jgi:TRAP-type C4-dicarboxylate transport system substrate-binding protein
MKKLLLVSLALCLVIVMLVVGCGNNAATTSSAPATSSTAATSAAPTTSTAAAGKTWELKYSHEQAVTAYYNVYGHQPMKEAIEKATNGVVKVTLYDSQTLVKSQQLWEAVKAGTADMGWLFTGYFPNQFSFAEASTLPFVFPNAAVGGKVTWEIYNKYPEIQAQFKDVKVLAAWTTEPYFIVSRSKFYKSLDDFANMKIRAPGGPPTEFVKALGATPMMKGMPDCYMDLKNGVFDAMPIPAEAYTGFKIYEVAPYVTYAPTVAMFHALIMNLNTWNSFPKEVQDQIMSVAGEKGSVMYSGGVFDKARADMKDTITKAGSSIQEYTLTDAEKQAWIDKAAKPVWDAWVKAQSGKGLTNAQQILDDTLALSKKYGSQ